MGNPTSAWDSADAWMFASIGSAEGRLPLAELLRAADRGNPAVLADGQVERALAKLVGSGLVRIYDDWTLETTDEGANLLEDSRRGDPEHLEIVRERLGYVDPTPIKLKVPKSLLEAATESR